jgi:rod shape-determining protein MreB
MALRVAQRHQLLQKVGGILELGAQTSELILLLSNGQTVGTTMPFGIGQYGVLLQHYLRETHGVVVGDSAAQETIKQWGHSILVGEGQTFVAVRAKALTTGKPTTVKFVLEDLTIQFEAATAVCLHEVQAFFAKRSASELERVMENGLVVMGGGALLSGLTQYLQTKLGLPLRVAPQPSAFLITRYSTVQQQTAYETY